ncbi:hypothetical protein Leryth_016982 [Lithospermum erythrorhizon]|nr:hypothetical protein Leryth_016982 [Lithospermum erythrorhizon]
MKFFGFTSPRVVFGVHRYCPRLIQATYKMEEPHLLIPHINSETGNWIVRITITKDIPTLICSTGLKLKYYVLADREWVLKRHTLIRVVLEVDPRLCDFLYGLTPFGQISSTVSKDRKTGVDRSHTSIDIMGVVIKVEESKVVTASLSPKTPSFTIDPPIEGNA